MRKKWMFIVPAAIVGFAVFIAIGGQVVALLWNWLTPTLFGWKEITFWQALGLLALCRILFGGFGGGGRRHRSRWHGGGRWGHMTPEERQRFRQAVHDRWGRPATPEETSE